MKHVLGAFLMLLALAWRATVVITPLLGVWLSSSLISYLGGPRGLALIGALLLFPLLPFAWEAFAEHRFRRQVRAAQFNSRRPPKRFLKAIDRFVLRTMFLNGAFIALLLAWYPKPSFTALATRGDWFLDGRHDPSSEQLRGKLFAAAENLEWLHELANPNPYKKEGDGKPVPADVKPIVEKKPEPKAAETGWAVGKTIWPLEDKPHPTIAAMSASAESGIQSVAAYVVQNESDPFLRVKALHDWAVSRLHYDKESITGERKPQDAESVFRNRMGVCEGYARLMVEFGRFADIPIEYVVGEVRERDGKVASSGHAWNTVKLGEQWYFLDATWDDPTSAGDAPADNYQTDYLFTPPSVAIFDHLPEDPRWQLLDRPLDRGEFLRQPMASPGFAKLGLTLLSPDRPLVDAKGSVKVELENPRGLFMLATITPVGGTDKRKCEVKAGTLVTAMCGLSSLGSFDLRLFANKEEYGSYSQVAAIGVHSM